MRRKILAVYCVLSLTFPASCIRSTASEWRNSQARRLYRAASPAEFAPQVRAVSSLSQQAEVPSPQPADETDALLRVVEEQPENAVALRRLADAYLNRGHFELALERYQALRRLISENAEVELAVARIYEKLGKHELALRHARLAASLDPNTEALEFLADLHFRLKNYAKAVETYEAALPQSARRPSILISLGEAHLRLKQWRQARSYLAEALAMDGSRSDVRGSLALAEVILSGPEKAIRQLLSQKNGPEALNQLGLSLMGLDRWQDARLVFERALRLKPDYPEARLNFEDADSHIAPPRIVKLPSFAAVADAAVNLDPSAADSPRKARASSEPLVQELELPLEEPVVAAPPARAAQTLPVPPSRPPIPAAPQETSEEAPEVEPIVFLKPVSERDEREAEAESRQAQVFIAGFETEGAAVADVHFPQQDTARELPTAPNHLGRAPAIVALSWRNIVEAATRIVYLPSSLEIDAKPSAALSLETVPALPRIPPQSSQRPVDNRRERSAQSRDDLEAEMTVFHPFGWRLFGRDSWPIDSWKQVQAGATAAVKLPDVEEKTEIGLDDGSSRLPIRSFEKKRFAGQGAAEGVPPAFVFSLMGLGGPVKLQLDLKSEPAALIESAGGGGPHSIVGKVPNRRTSQPADESPSAEVGPSRRAMPPSAAVGFLPQPLKCIALGETAIDGCIQSVIGIWKFDSIVPEPRRLNGPVVKPNRASDTTIRFNGRRRVRPSLTGANDVVGQ